MRPDRVLFPASGFTKSEAAAYYQKIAPVLLPHLKNVPVSFKRYPDTIRGESFWEKDAPSFTPKWVKTVAVPRRGGESDIHYILINDLRTLRWIVDVGGIEIHPFLHRAPHLERATAMVFDLDPGEGASIADCCEVALLLRDALFAIKLRAFVKVSGSKGLQVYVPLNGTDTHDATESFARFIADELARAHPKRIVSKMARQLRARKVFIDWSQNADYKTTVSAYSLRAKREAPFVSMPITWEEVEAAENLDFAPDEAVKRVKKRGDLFAPVLKIKQRLPVAGRRSPGKRAAEPGDRRPPTGDRLPKMKSQSGRRLFVLPKTDTGDELWLEMHGKFKRWILRPDREGGPQLIAMPAGDFKVDPAYYRGEVPVPWRHRIKLEDLGAYELIDGSYQRRRFDLFFSGKTLQGEWLLEKLGDESHRSWRFVPARV
jgi:bifunctional non-homologous end joining protein LigD